MTFENVHRPNVGGFKELIRLFFPILAITFSSGLFLLIEKLFLAQVSTLSMEAAVNAAYATQIIQTPCIALAMMSQVYVARWYGAQETKLIGPGIWQMIWFSFLSMIITLPFSIIYGTYFFKETPIEPIVWPYYLFLVSGNFLYPLGTTLSCFFLGRGKTNLILVVTVFIQLLKILLAYILIFGLYGFMKPWGLLGGAVSTIIAQAGYCITLFFIFLSKKNSELFNSRKWFFDAKLFWESIQPGFLRALNRILTLTSWASTAHLMMSAGTDYILVLSIGGTLFLFLPFLGDSICQSLTTIVSQMIGAKKYHLLDKPFFSGFILVLITIFLTSLPLLFFPIETFHYLFPKTILGDAQIWNVFMGIWLCLSMFTFDFLPISYILAFKDTKFSFFIGALSWINGYLLMYFFIKIVKIPADQFWMTLTLMHGSTAMLYFMRMQWLKSKLIKPLKSST